MDNIFKGKLKRWNDDRGFGFITPENGKDEVFLHISALQNKRRRPVVGDVILYQLQIGNDGKSKAISAKIDGVASAKTTRHYRNDGAQSKWPSQVILIVVLLAIGISAYKAYTSVHNGDASVNSTGIVNAATPAEEIAKPDYQCDGRTSCSQMTSCAEAQFFISNCPGTTMDGDNDGVPCESQWCR